MQVLGISGSLRRRSYNTALLETAAAVGGSKVELKVWPALGLVPAFDEDLEDLPLGVALLRTELGRADAVLFATPEYNASIPGALKNALDWISRPLGTNPLRGKPVAVIGGSQGLFGAAWAQAELRKVLRTIGARVLDEPRLELPYVQEAFSRDGHLLDPEHVSTLQEILEALEGNPCRRAA
jgi:chromate reductase, NAD(P)H dehydrogenase (quinone)